MKVIIDTDILSMFAKANAVDVLTEFLGATRVAIVPAIRDEISIPLQYGYEFPKLVLSQIPVVRLTEQAWDECERLRASGTSLGKGELEAVALCKTERALFVTNDVVARKLAQGQGVQVASLQAILRGLWQSGLRSKVEVKRLLARIKEADYLEVSLEAEREIFGD
ncbi:MAG: hypothetical protein ACUVWR_05720 [Anaerolineae bacterium]